MKIKSSLNNQQGYTGLIVVAVLAVVFVLGFVAYGAVLNRDTKQAKTVTSYDSYPSKKESESSKKYEHLSYEHQATLLDVTKAQTFEGIAFSGNSSGKAYATFEDNKTVLFASFTNLPTLPADLFYEGWVVGGAEGIVSTGELKKEAGVFVNNFVSDKNITDSKRYVLTIEPRDGNDAPAAGHVVDGEFASKSSI